MITALLLASSLAFANPAAAPVAPAEEPKIEINVPFRGVTAVYNGECEPSVMAMNTSAPKGGALAIELARAAAICRESKALAEEHALRLQMQLVRGPAEAKLIQDAGTGLAIGRDVEVITPEGLTVRGGGWLKTKAVADAMVSANPIANYGAIGGVDQPTMGMIRAMGLAPGHQVGGSSQQMAMVLGSELGSAPVAAPTAPCGTAAQCQKAIDKLQDELSVADD